MHLWCLKLGALYFDTDEPDGPDPDPHTHATTDTPTHISCPNSKWKLKNVKKAANSHVLVTTTSQIEVLKTSTPSLMLIFHSGLNAVYDIPFGFGFPKNRVGSSWKNNNNNNNKSTKLEKNGFQKLRFFAE